MGCGVTIAFGHIFEVLHLTPISKSDYSYAKIGIFGGRNSLA